MNKTYKLVLSIVLDALGYVSLVFPPFDFLWAPLSGYIMTRLYKGKIGKIAGIIGFIEEALPYTDVIPTFTLTWIYTYMLQKNRPTKKAT